MTGIKTKLISAEELAEIIQAGDALKAEVEIDAAEFEKAGDHTEADILREIAGKWDRLVSDYRGE